MTHASNIEVCGALPFTPRGDGPFQAGPTAPLVAAGCAPWAVTAGFTGFESTYLELRGMWWQSPLRADAAQPGGAHFNRRPQHIVGLPVNRPSINVSLGNAAQPGSRRKIVRPCTHLALLFRDVGRSPHTSNFEVHLRNCSHAKPLRSLHGLQTIGDPVRQGPAAQHLEHRRVRLGLPPAPVGERQAQPALPEPAAVEIAPGAGIISTHRPGNRTPRTSTYGHEIGPHPATPNGRRSVFGRGSACPRTWL